MQVGYGGEAKVIFAQDVLKASGIECRVKLFNDDMHVYHVGKGLLVAFFLGFICFAA